MEYTEAVSLIKANYSQSQATKILNLHEGTVMILAKFCKENTKKDLTDATIDRLLPMEPDRQAGWLVNPFMEFLMDRLMASYLGGQIAAAGSTGATTVKPDTSNKKPDPVPEPKKVEPEPEPDAPLFDLFG